MSLGRLNVKLTFVPFLEQVFVCLLLLFTMAL